MSLSLCTPHLYPAVQCHMYCMLWWSICMLGWCVHTLMKVNRHAELIVAWSFFGWSSASWNTCQSMQHFAHHGLRQAYKTVLYACRSPWWAKRCIDWQVFHGALNRPKKDQAAMMCACVYALTACFQVCCTCLTASASCSSCEGDTHLQCVVCDSGNWCFSPSHCMTDCVDVLFYRQWTMRSWRRWKRHLKETRHLKRWNSMILMVWLYPRSSVIMFCLE